MEISVRSSYIFLLVAISLYLICCASAMAAMSEDGLKITYPFDLAVFPPDIAPPHFLWEDGNSADKWEICLYDTEGKVLSKDVVGKCEWQPSEKLWKVFTSGKKDSWAKVVVCRLNNLGKAVKGRAAIKISTSKDTVDAPIFYRDVNLPFVEAVKDPTKIKWRFGSISSNEQPPVVLEKLPVCGNCHSFSSDGKLIGMDVDYANDKGSYIVTKVKKHMPLTKSQVITWADYDRDKGARTFGLLSQLSPDGRYAVSTVDDLSVFVPAPDLAFSQLFFPVKGILAFYDRQKKEYFALKGADDSAYVQSNPCWSPDGKYILFARAKKHDMPNVVIEDNTVPLLTAEMCAEFLKENKKFRYDIYRVPFNNGKGGKAEPLAGASHNGRSNFFPRYSPDGQWIVFCQADSYMLLQKDSELFILPAAGGHARRMQCNTNRMNSWHSWSPNSKWLVFASKTLSAYTQLFLTHVDEQGNSTPPVLLQNFVSAKRAANIPEFVNTSADAIEKISEQFVDDESFVRAAKEYVSAKEYDKALVLFKRSLQINPDNETALQSVANVLYGRGQVKEAVEYYERVVALTKNNSDAHYMLGRAYLRLGKRIEANKHLLQAAKNKPNDPVIQVAIGNVFYEEKSYEMAIERYDAALKFDKTYWVARFRKGRALKKLGQVDKAISELKVLALTDIPSWEVHNELGQLLLRKGDGPEAARALQKAIELAPRGKVEPFVHLAYHEISTRNFKKAEKLLHAALATSPRNGRAHSAMGHLMLKTGRYHAAEKHYRAALYNVADKGFVHFELGNLYAKKRKKSLAKKHYQKALEYNPENKKAKRALWRLGH